MLPADADQEVREPERFRQNWSDSSNGFPLKERVAKPKGEAGKKPQEAQNAQKGARIFVLLVLFVVTSPPLQSFATSS
ncbi:MAG TPA: hypothetical protein VE422_44180, partial [Terriglobia bacterium]|nr:hypothetical protein [Terriglobia bacterium]